MRLGNAWLKYPTPLLAKNCEVEQYLSPITTNYKSLPCSSWFVKIPESEGSIPLGNSEFLLCTTLMTRRNKISSYFFTELKIYHPSHSIPSFLLQFSVVCQKKEHSHRFFCFFFFKLMFDTHLWQETKTYISVSRTKRSLFLPFWLLSSWYQQEL